MNPVRCPLCCRASTVYVVVSDEAVLSAACMACLDGRRPIRRWWEYKDFVAEVKAVRDSVEQRTRKRRGRHARAAH